MPNSSSPDKRRIVVLGAGPGGLAAAHVLTRNQEATAGVDVLELKDQVGGLCITLDQGGFKFDLGGHRWFTKNQELHKWFLELMKGELVTVDRISRIYFAGKYFNYPISIKNVLKSAGLFTSAHAFLSYGTTALRSLFRRREPQNIEDAYVAQFGKKLFEMFFRRYTEKVWGLPCTELSADWVKQRSKGLSIMTALKDAMWKSKDVVSLIDQFVYPRDGYERICIRMAEDVTRGGGRIHLGSPVKRLEYRGPGDWLVHHAGPDGPRTIEASDVISTIPLPHLVRMVSPAAPQAVLDASSTLRFRDLITVTVMLRKKQVTPDTWLYVHDEDLIFARLHEPKNWSPAMVPGEEFTSVVCECFCSKDEPIWARPDGEISDRVIADLSDRLGFITRDEVIDTAVVRTRFAYPVYDLDYRPKIDQVYGFLNAHEGIHIVGRGGTFRYNNADHSIEMGQLLAKKLLGASDDHMSVNTEAAYHEEIRRTQASVRT